MRQNGHESIKDEMSLFSHKTAMEMPRGSRAKWHKCDALIMGLSFDCECGYEVVMIVKWKYSE